MKHATAQIGAFFDVDGTLVPEPSLERRFFSGLRRSGAIPAGNYLRWTWSAMGLVPSRFSVEPQGGRWLLLPTAR